MSQKEQLKAHIQGLCQELGIDKMPYNSNSTIDDLTQIVDDLEAKLPDGEGEDDGLNTTGSGESSDGIQSGMPVHTTESGALPEGSQISEESVEVKADDNGDVYIQATSTLGLLSHGQAIILKQGAGAYVEESQALAAVEAGLAFFITQ